MNTWKAAAATIAVVALGSTGAWAQSAADPNAAPTQVPQTAPVTPSDPAMTPAPAGEGTSTGETGYSSPAGIPADPTTNENQQPGMSPQNPTDPATGGKPSARVPSSTPGTGTSAP
jgi:hypothetical protein